MLRRAFSTHDPSRAQVDMKTQAPSRLPSPDNPDTGPSGSRHPCSSSDGTSRPPPNDTSPPRSASLLFARHSRAKSHLPSDADDHFAHRVQSLSLDPRRDVLGRPTSHTAPSSAFESRARFPENLKPRPDPRSTFLSIFRRASTSLRSVVAVRNHDLAPSSIIETAPPSQREDVQLQTPALLQDVRHPLHSRPATAHSTWHRLRQAASFRHSRTPYSFDQTPLDQLDAPRPSLAIPRENPEPPLPLPVPSIGGEPPFIPSNTGAAAKASAALQNEFLMLASSPAASSSSSSRHHSGHASSLFHNKWLTGPPHDDQNTDRESGIGINVTLSEPDVDTPPDELVSPEDATKDETSRISRIDFISRLPTELSIQILAHLDATGLAVASLVSRQWNFAVSNQHIWRDSFMREKTATYATSGPVRAGAGLGVPPILPETNWRAIYRVREELDANWAKGEARSVYLNGHRDSIYCLQFDEHKVITGSRDQTIRIWDIHTLQCILVIGPPEVVGDISLLLDEHGNPVHNATLPNNQRIVVSTPALVSFPTHHKASILCLQYDDRILVTGSSDSTCIVYNVRSGYRPMRRLRHHTAAVLDLAFDEKHIVTCSRDISICVWDRATGALLRQLSGHAGPVNAVQMRGNTIVSCSGDFRVKLWNIDTGKNIREFVGHTKGLACSQFSEDGRYIASAGNDKMIRIWDANTGECVQQMRAHENLVRSLHIDSISGRLVSGSYDTDIKVFDMETGVEVLAFPKWHARWVLSAKSDYRRIVSSGQDPKILIMDFGAEIEGIELLESGKGRDVPSGYI